MTKAVISVKVLEETGDLRACEGIQHAAWGMVDEDIVPSRLLRALGLHGGLVLGAFDGARLVGFLFGYPGLLPPGDARIDWLGTPHYHVSQMMGVLPDYQDRGVGYALKCEQRHRVIEQGFRLVTWTFDPLMSRNAHLNITRLGTVCRRYLRDVYGEQSGIYAGLPTDRFEVDWWIASRRVEQAIDPPERARPPVTLAEWRRAGAQPANPTTARADGLRVPPELVRQAGRRARAG